MPLQELSGFHLDARDLRRIVDADLERVERQLYPRRRFIRRARNIHQVTCESIAVSTHATRRYSSDVSGQTIQAVRLNLNE